MAHKGHPIPSWVRDLPHSASMSWQRSGVAGGGTEAETEADTETCRRCLGADIGLPIITFK